MFQLYGCPTHYGVGDTGLIQSIDYLTKNFKNLQMNKVSEITLPEAHLPNLKNLNSVIATCEAIARYALQIQQSGRHPLMIAGDHSAAMGSVSATCVHHSGEIGLIWIDAHPDINTDRTTATGNIHGMPVAALLGMGEPRLTRFLTDTPKLRARNIVMLGLRDIDPPEREFLEKLNIRYYTWDKICRRGLKNCLNESIAYLKHCSGIHISFDIDSMDPALMPGVSVPVRGGFTEKDVFTMTRILLTQLPVKAMDIVEFNHAHDRDDITASFVSRLTDHIQKYARDIPGYMHG